MDKINMNNYKIIASLTYGKKISGAVYVLIYIALLLCVIIVPLAVFCAIYYQEIDVPKSLFTNWNWIICGNIATKSNDAPQ